MPVGEAFFPSCAAWCRALVACVATHPLAFVFIFLCAADGVYTGEYTTLALCGFIRGMAEADGALDRLWTKAYDESKAAGAEI